MTYNEFNQVYEGNIRNVRKVELNNYWENSNQISKPASDEQVEAFLKSKEYKSPFWSKVLIIIVVVIAVLLKMVL